MLPKLSRTTLADQATQTLIQYIVGQGLKPGDTLPAEGKLAADLGVSRTIVRESLKELVGKNIIEIVNGKRAVVKPIDNSPLNNYFYWALHFNKNAALELMELRRGLEVESARLAAQRRTGVELQQLTTTVTQMSQFMGDPEGFATCDVAFHLQIASAARNRMLYLHIESIRDFTREVSMEGLRRSPTPPKFKDAFLIHERLLRKIADSDAQGAADAMTAHFEGQFDWLNKLD